MVATQTYEITPEMIDNWAAQVPERKPVAERCEQSSCPIAATILAAYPEVDAVLACYDEIYFKKEIEPTEENWWRRYEIVATIDTPDWANRFMTTVDKRRDGITAASVRKILKAVTAEEATVVPV